MTASTGHIFVLRFYPKGHPNQPEGKYLSLFLHLHSDSNGLDLEYPWINQFLKYIVQDQISDAVNRNGCLINSILTVIKKSAKTEINPHISFSLCFKISEMQTTQHQILYVSTPQTQTVH